MKVKMYVETPCGSRLWQKDIPETIDLYENHLGADVIVYDCPFCGRRHHSTVCVTPDPEAGE